MSWPSASLSFTDRTTAPTRRSAATCWVRTVAPAGFLMRPSHSVWSSKRISSARPNRGWYSSSAPMAAPAGMPSTSTAVMAAAAL